MSLSDLQVLNIKALGPQFRMLSPEAQKGYREAVAMVAEKEELERTLQELGNRVPPTQVRVYHQRLVLIEPQIKTYTRVDEAIRRGFDPYRPPPRWFSGPVEQNQARPGELYFSAPIPARVLRRLDAAKKTGLFDRILVYSPRQEHFTQIAPLRVDPVLVGYIGEESFLIAYWDLSGDRDYFRTANP